ncbi:transcriptional regulator, TetR family [Plantibacter flavus]|uniref:TetR family transcriptional regulator n=1 Tax=Plantibacter flavus TaxID=150123 RepID=A0A3N2BZH8_9MICO|nr:TetR/AcrR family transcriptional regulator [Plantibacter flavus]ROR80649.1 TetR family transcriptional regulator [Plantibacter flavus]SMG32517.1 transcriptional regulator, TetR family [Plantibacter flavus]
MRVHEAVESPSDEAPVESARRQRTRERLVDAAYEVFAEFGVHAASVEQISERAGFTRGAFYSNFDSKEELFFALESRENQLRLDRLEAGLQAVSPSLLDAAGRYTEGSLEALIRAFLELQPDDRRWCLVQSEFRMLAMRDADVAARYLQHQESAGRQLAAWLDQAAGLAHVRFTIPTPDIANIVVALYESAIQTAVLMDPDGDEGSPRELAMRTLPAIVRALTESVTE